MTKKYANFGLRLIATIIDGLILGVAMAILTSLFRWIPPLFGRRVFGQRLFSTLIGALYSILLWVNWNGQTPGKKIMSIKVIREDGKALDYPEAIVRYLCYIISALPLCLGYLWIIWDEKKQGWHDKLAKTLVVKQ